jgi:RecA/RadA recombinase
MSLIDKLKKNSTITESAILEDSIYYTKKDIIKTKIPALNVAQSGDPLGGYVPGLTLWAGPSKHFKTGFMLLNIKAYLDAYKDAVCIFYDSEFGTPQSYFKRTGIDTKRILHTPVTNIEDLKFDLVAQLEGIKRGDHVFIAIDSLGNLASKKEVEDAKDQKSVADMSRAKANKSLFRIIQPMLVMKNIPCQGVAHTYDTMEMFSTQVVSGGKGQYYSADNIYILGRQQQKGTAAEGTDKEIIGWDFIITVEKSRYVKEKAKIPVTVSYEKGVSPFSGLLAWAEEFGLVTKGKIGNSVAYSRPFIKGDELVLTKNTNTADFWAPFWKDTNFADCIKAKYKLPDGEENVSKAAEEVDEEVVSRGD